MHTNFWSENLKGSNHSKEDLGIDTKVIFECILGK
jgi:hypothetical protein